jgi:hypothetical protein
MLLPEKEGQLELSTLKDYDLCVALHRPGGYGPGENHVSIEIFYLDTD